MMKFLCRIVLLAATTTTSIVAVPIGAVAAPACCKCDKDNTMMDIIRIESINDHAPDRSLRDLQSTTEQGGGDVGNAADLVMVGTDSLGGCCPCPSKLLVTDDGACLSSRASEEFCRGTPVSVIGVSDLINTGGEDMRLLTTPAALEGFALLSKVNMLAGICRGTGARVLEAVRLVAHRMEFPDSFPERLHPDFIIGGAPDTTTARRSLLELVRVLEVDVMAQMKGESDYVGLPDELPKKRAL